MATLRQAEKAREQHAESLRRSKAHAIEVAKVKQGRKETFGVVAYFEKQPRSSLEQTLEIEMAGKKIKVPLSVRVVERFKPE